MSAGLLFFFIIIYFAVLLAVAKITGKNSNNMSFFIGNKNSNWMLVAFGMIGTSLSGVTFVSVPGAVGKDGFHYLQITIGYLIGYVAIAYVLLPIYYKMNLTSIYNYLETRLGFNAYKTGASFFVLSRTLGATARLYLVVKILQVFILDSMGVPFWGTTLVILAMILLYTYEGGVKTIVYTDTLQTSGMLLGLIIYLPYHKIAATLKFLCVVLLVYLIVPFLYKQDWLDIAKNTFIPNIQFNKEFVAVLVGILGTTISPYLFFWQASMEVEEMAHKKRHLIVNKRIITDMKQDVDFGMSFSGVVMFFIILTTGTVLYKGGIHQIDTVEQAAAALKPLA